MTGFFGKWMLAGFPYASMTNPVGEPLVILRLSGLVATAIPLTESGLSTSSTLWHRVLRGSGRGCIRWIVDRGSRHVFVFSSASESVP